MSVVNVRLLMACVLVVKYEDTEGREYSIRDGDKREQRKNDENCEEKWSAYAGIVVVTSDSQLGFCFLLLSLLMPACLPSAPAAVPLICLKRLRQYPSLNWNVL